MKKGEFYGDSCLGQRVRKTEGDSELEAPLLSSLPKIQAEGESQPPFAFPGAPTPQSVTQPVVIQRATPSP